MKDICKRENDLLVSADDIKELAKNERNKAIDDFMDRLSTISIVNYNNCKEIAEQLKEVEYNNGWIPCSERLPDYGVGVLLQDFYEGYEFGERELRDGIDGFTDGDFWTSANNYIAWQPLPQPFVEK